MTLAESRLAASFLELDYPKFVKEYVHRQEGQTLYLKNRGDSCIFLVDERCRIYPQRPLQCRTFPFWPEVLKSKDRWTYLTTQCPGIDQGPLFPATTIKALVHCQRHPESGLSCLDVPGIGEDEDKPTSAASDPLTDID